MTPQEIHNLVKDIPNENLCSFEDIKSICKIADKLPKKIDILEIGTCWGRSACVWSLATEGTVYSIDNWDNRKAVKENAERIGAKVIPILGDSHKIKWNKEVDVLYIDGAHECSDVIQDIRRFEPYAKILIVGHDYNYLDYPYVRIVADSYYPNLTNYENIWFSYKNTEMPLITIISLLSEREYCIDEWLKAWDKLDFRKENLNVIWYVSGEDEEYQTKLRDWYLKNESKFNSFQFILSGKPIYKYNVNTKDPTKSDNQISENYNYCKQFIETKYVLFWEDDIIPPPDSLKKLLFLIQDNPDIYVCSGKAVFRPSVEFGKNKLLAWNIKSQKTFPDEDLCVEVSNNVEALKNNESEGIKFIGAIHFGFTLLKSDFVKDYVFRGKSDSLFSSCDIICGYNINKLGKKVALDNSIKLKHYDITGGYV